MSCPHCGGETIRFAVPDDLSRYAPDGDATTLCARCLRTAPADGPPAGAPRFDLVGAAFPDGDAGASLALAVGMLDSLALNRAAIVACCRRAERAGADVSLALDRLDASPDVTPHFDLGRRRRQLEQML